MANIESNKPKIPENIDQLAARAKEIDEKKWNEAEKAYKASYKNILWIDDEIEGVERYLYQPQLSLKNNITLVKSFEYAVSEITKQYSKYDLVIFDLNLGEKIFEYIPENIKEIFKKHNIILDDNTFKNEDNKKAAGMWLYFLLLSVGYPLNRMIIYSAYIKDDKDKKNNKFSFKEIPLTFELETLDKRHHSLDIEKYFSGSENSYYRVRRLVFQACDYWEKEYKNNENASEIPFNEIYELDIPLNSFKEMLEHVKMMFPVLPPYKEEEREKIYYEAARVVSVFHEEQAKINKLKNKPEIKKFHQTVRYFRNWSAHNKIKEAAMSADFFAVFFCIALRTYFQDDYNKALDYEKAYFNNQEHEEIEDKELEQFFSNFFYNSIKKDFDIDLNGVFRFKQDNNGNLISDRLNLDQFIFNSGQQNTTLPLKCVFFSILASENYIFQLKCENPREHTSFYKGSWTLCLKKSPDFKFEPKKEPKYKSFSNYEKEFLIRVYNCIKNADYKQ